MTILLDGIYLALLVSLSPWLALRAWTTGKYREGWAEKFLGRAPRRIGNCPCVWFHAVSVGEVKLLQPIVAELARRRPGWEVVISTTTATGLEIARRNFPDLVTFYAPLDFGWAVRRAIRHVRPSILVLVELEIWPNLIREAARSGAHVTLINGRLSPRSHRGYRLLRPLLRATFARFGVVATQTREYADRFLDLGVPPERLRVTGSIKYDNLEADRDNPRTLRLRSELGLRPSEVVFVAGSTMEGEEEAALAAFEAARVDHPHLRLILVPRHPERFDRVAALLESRGVPIARRSRIASGEVSASRGGLHDQPPVILIDTLGELSAVWGLADIAFVGGSLYSGRGGQNMMEPAAFGAAVMFGPHTTNFRDAVEGLLSRGGARQVADADELTLALKDDLEDPESAATRGEAARIFVLAQYGAASRTLDALDELMERPERRLDGERARIRPRLSGCSFDS